MSKLLLGCACAGTVLGGMYLHGDLDGGQIYNVPIRDAYLRAQNADIGPMVGTGLLDSGGCDIERTENESVAWACERSGTTVGRLVATMKDMGDGRTRVWISFRGTDAEGEDVERSRSYMKKVGKTVMGETVAAAIDQRPMDQAVVHAALQAYVMTNMNDLGAEIGATFDNVSAEMKKHGSGNSGNSELREAQREAGRPMIDVGGSNPSRNSRYP